MMMMFMTSDDDDDDYYNRWRLKLEGETENMGVCTKELKGVTAAVLMATPYTNSLAGESGGQIERSWVLMMMMFIPRGWNSVFFWFWNCRFPLRGPRKSPSNFPVS